jgi:hypothetical protein
MKRGDTRPESLDQANRVSSSSYDKQRDELRRGSEDAYLSDSSVSSYSSGGRAPEDMSEGELETRRDKWDARADRQEQRMDASRDVWKKKVEERENLEREAKYIQAKALRDSLKVDRKVPRDYRKDTLQGNMGKSIIPGLVKSRDVEKRAADSFDKQSEKFDRATNKWVAYDDAYREKRGDDE